MWKMYKHDLTEGIGRRSVYLVLPVMISLFSCIGMHYKLVQFQHINERLGNGTWMDYWMYFIQGGKQYKFSIFNFFEMPVRWICFYVLFLVCLNNYPLNDLKKMGTQIIIRSGSRLQWWISKFLWLVTYAVVYMGICMVVVVLYALANGVSLDLHLTMSVAKVFTKQSFLRCSTLRLLCIAVVQPGLLLILLGIFQMALSMKISEISAFIVMFAALVISSYKRNILLFGNWGMPYRMFPAAQHGLDPKLCLILLCGSILVLLMAGWLLYEKRDILEDRRDI